MKKSKPCPADGINGFKAFLVGDMNLKFSSLNVHKQAQQNKSLQSQRYATQVVEEPKTKKVFSSRGSSTRLILSKKQSGIAYVKPPPPPRPVIDPQGSSLDTEFLHLLAKMNDRVKIYKKAFYHRQTYFSTPSNKMLLSTEQRRKHLLKERRKLNRLDGTILRSSYSKVKLTKEDSESESQEQLQLEKVQFEGKKDKRSLIRRMTQKIQRSPSEQRLLQMLMLEQVKENERKQKLKEKFEMKRAVQKINNEVMHHGLSQQVSQHLFSEQNLKKEIKQNKTKQAKPKPRFKASRVRFFEETPINSLATSENESFFIQDDTQKDYSPLRIMSKIDSKESLQRMQALHQVREKVKNYPQFLITSNDLYENLKNSTSRTSQQFSPIPSHIIKQNSKRRNKIYLQSLDHWPVTYSQDIRAANQTVVHRELPELISPRQNLIVRDLPSIIKRVDSNNIRHNPKKSFKIGEKIHEFRFRQKLASDSNKMKEINLL